MAGSISQRDKRIANKLVSLGELSRVLSKEKSLSKKIVLVGGCFDILHKGHILFLEAAKKRGDLLFVLLESDENIKIKKGVDRPLNSQKNRAIVLSALSFVDYIILLTGVTKDKEYDRLMVQISPDVVAMTAKDSGIEQRKKQCESIGAKLELVIDRINDKSTTNLINKSD